MERIRRLLSLCLAVLFLVLHAAWAEETAVTHLELNKKRDYNEAKQVVAALAKYPNLQSVTFGDVGIKASVLNAIREAFPHLDLEYTFLLCEKRVRSTATSVNLYPHKYKRFESFLKELAYLPNLRELTAFHLAFTYEQMAELQNRFPELKVNARVHLGGGIARTTATAFSTRHSYHSTRYTEQDFMGVAFCEDLLALDIGHNTVENLDFLKYLPNLKILILADNQITDISPIAQLKDLEYLELFENPIEDISPLAGLEKLIDLNMAFCSISDASPLLQMPNLQRLYLAKNPLSAQQQEMLLAHFPGCDIDFHSTISPTAGGWRQKHPRYLQIVDIFTKGQYRELRK